MMLTRIDWEQIEDQYLAPYAQKSSQSRGRKYPEAEHSYRSIYQRDRDRIIHSRAFRRLQYKTQVFVNHEGDHYRTRLTHTTEVAQISRILARTLKLNEDLAESIALAHDLGHPPFGHAGEAALNQLMKKHGGFEHNKQSLRIVEQLEKRYTQFDGLNLTWEVREGLMKHRQASSENNPELKPTDRQPTLEGQIADIADDIAYNAHDIDDGLSSGYFSAEAIQTLPIWQKCLRETADPEIQHYDSIRNLINHLVTDVVHHTLLQIQNHQIDHADKVRQYSKKLVAFSPAVNKQVQALKQFLMVHLYTNEQVEKMHQKTNRILEELFGLFINNPHLLPQTTQSKLDKTPLEIIVCDYIAGMTDRFAFLEHQRLCRVKGS